MTDVVEAMARAAYKSRNFKTKWEALPEWVREGWRTEQRAAIRAVTEAGGLVVGKMPVEIDPRHGQSLQKIWWCHGNNHALAAVRAEAVEGV